LALRAGSCFGEELSINSCFGAFSRLTSEVSLWAIPMATSTIQSEKKATFIFYR
jgi:hypothetical protein